MIGLPRSARIWLMPSSADNDPAVRAALSRYLNCAPQDLRITRTEARKPLLASHPACHISVSHAGGWLALACSQTGSIGLDIEALGHRGRLLAIAQRYFAPEEINWIRSPDADLTHRFMQLWTLKEALGKLVGTGLGPALMRRSTTIQRDRPEPVESWTRTNLGAVVASQRWSSEQMLMTLASLGARPVVEIEVCNAEGQLPAPPLQPLP